MFFVRMGMEVIEVKRVLRFQQKPWMKNYIDKLTRLGAKSFTDSGKILF